MVLPSILLAALDDAFEIRLFGKPDADFLVAAGSPLTIRVQPRALPGVSPKPFGFVWVHGSMILGRCVKLPKPFLTILPNPGDPADGCEDFPAANGYLMWVIPKGQPFIAFSHTVGTVEDIVSRHAARGEREVLWDWKCDLCKLNPTFWSAVAALKAAQAAGLINGSGHCKEVAGDSARLADILSKVLPGQAGLVATVVSFIVENCKDCACDQL